MASNIDMDKEHIVQQIIAQWTPLSEKHKQLLEAHLDLQHYKKNDYIHKELQIPTHIFYLISGKVKVFKDGIGGRNQIVRVVKPWNLFGVRPYLAGDHYRTVAVALEDCVVASVPNTVFETLMEQNYSVARYIITRLSEELGHADDRIVNLTQKHIRGRLAEALLFLKDSYGLEEDGYTLSIHLSREDLANLSNMTTSNAIRTLSTFANENLVAIDGRKIKFIDVEGLAKVSKTG